MPTTLCGYELPEVRRSLRDAIGRRDRRAAHRWAAELVATPGAIGSLWASFWLACESMPNGNPTLPILLHQTWDSLVAKAHEHNGDWAAFRNDSKVRASVAEITARLLEFPRQTTTTWPTKEVVLYDVSTLKDGTPAAAADSQVVLAVWNRNCDSMDLRQMAGCWIEALQRGDIRIALSAVMWTMLPTTELKCGARGPKTLSVKQSASPIWFWLAMGSSLLKSQAGLHRGWMTMHDAIIDAMMMHFKRWSATERLRILLFWILQIRASMLEQPSSLWSIQAIQHTSAEIDLPYKEIAAEVVSAPFAPAPAPAPANPKVKPPVVDAQEEKLRKADEQIMAMLGITDVS